MRIFRLSLVLIAAMLMVAASVSPQSSKQAGYLGAQECAACHAAIVEKQRNVAMAIALEKTADCTILRTHADLTFQAGKFKYRITRQGGQSIYTVSDGASEISVPILYCFGQGKSGQTYVYEYQGERHESRVSYYIAIDGLDITLGHSPRTPATLVEAAGRRMSVDETMRCFGCHTTGAIAKAADPTQLGLDHLAPGVRCESCHGPGERHVAAMRAGTPDAGKMKKLGALDGDDISQTLCGACHRSAEDIMELPARGGLNNVRFQPYRIFNSRCYSADKRIGCTGCHDPHGATETSAAFYDAKCAACHSSKEAGTRVCKSGNRNCAGCHMPKIELPGAHFKFTDHRIRIVREGAPYPN
jgi:hypothetical protein